MRKVKMSTNIVASFIPLFILPFSLGCFITSMVLFSKTNTEYNPFLGKQEPSLPVFIPVIILFFSLIILILGVVISVHNTIAYQNMKKAKTGHPSTAVVKECYRSIGRNTFVYLTYEYKTESGEMVMTSFAIDPKHEHYFQEGKTIPVLLNGDYAIYDIESIKNQVNNVSSKICYCTNCGSEMNSADSFCSKCGFKKE